MADRPNHFKEITPSVTKLHHTKTMLQIWKLVWHKLLTIISSQRQNLYELCKTRTDRKSVPFGSSKFSSKILKKMIHKMKMNVNIRKIMITTQSRSQTSRRETDEKNYREIINPLCRYQMHSISDAFAHISF